MSDLIRVDVLACEVPGEDLDVRGRPHRAQHSLRMSRRDFITFACDLPSLCLYVVIDSEHCVADGGCVGRDQGKGQGIPQRAAITLDTSAAHSGPPCMPKLLNTSVAGPLTVIYRLPAGSLPTADTTVSPKRSPLVFLSTSMISPTLYCTHWDISVTHIGSYGPSGATRLLTL